MEAVSFKRTDCNLCGSGNVECVVHLAPIPCASPNAGLNDDNAEEIRRTLIPLDVYLCRDCGHVQLMDIVRPEILYSNYRYTTSISLGLDQHFAGLAADVMTRIAPPKGGRVLEMGSNDGTLLRLFATTYGMEVLGVDPAVSIAERATASGVRTIGGFFTGDLARSLSESWGKASVVLANYVFANINDLSDVMAGVRTMLADDGVFVFETQYGADVFERTLLDTIYHEHISYFNVKPLQSFFARYGMELIDVQRIPTKGGSIRGTVQLAGGPRPRGASVDEFIAREEATGCADPAYYREFSRVIADLKGELDRLLDEHAAAGGVIAGYGASIGTLPLLHHFDLARRFQVIADDKPVTDAIRGPGYDIPVVPSSELLDRGVTCTVVLAWRYRDPIVARNQEYLRRGGRFILPLPRIEVLGQATA